MVRKNVAFAGLTAAGKTTHAKLLAKSLGYEYVSATEILLRILGIEKEAERIWFAESGPIWAAREGDAADEELERQLTSMASRSDGIVFDTWALAWIGEAPLLRIWIESDLESRARKCYVSQGEDKTLSVLECRDLVVSKDELTRASFLRRHHYDIAVDRSRYDVELNNSDLIPQATDQCAASGVARFAPVVHALATAHISGVKVDATVRVSHRSEDGLYAV